MDNVNTYKVNKEAVKKIAEKVYDNGSTVINRNDLEELFPELQESEDEKIRKELISFVRGMLACHDKPNAERDEKYESWIAWLEKQCEHANFRNKIQVGDKVTRNKNGVLVNLSQLKRIAKPAENKGKHGMGISEATKQELEDNLNKALEKETPESWNKFLDEQGEHKPTIEMITPEESLGIDSDTYNKIVDECIYGEQKPAEWHREDEQNLNACLGYIPDEFLRRWLTDIIHVKYDEPADLPKGEDYGIDGLYAAIDILQKTLGEVEGYQSDDGILEHKCAISTVKELYKQKSTDKIESKQEQLTKFEKAVKQVMEEAIECGDTHNLKADADMLLRLVQKPWSEEDERTYKSVLYAFEHNYPLNSEQQKFVKSIKERYTWKPSYEQMKALNIAMCGVDDPLFSLYQNLKKLKG